MCTNCPHKSDPNLLDLQIAHEDALFMLANIRSHFYILFDYVIGHSEKTDQSIQNHADRLFADNMVVAVRDMRNSVIDVQELLQRGKP